MNQKIHEFLKQLVLDSGEKDIPENVLETMINDLNTRLEDRLILVALNNMPADKQDELEQMAENKASAGEIEAYVKANIPNWEEVFAKALMEFREIYLGKQ